MASTQSILTITKKVWLVGMRLPPSLRTLDEEIMSSDTNTNSIVKDLPDSLLKAFMYCLSPLAIAGQVGLIISKFNSGISSAGHFGLPNWVTMLCCTITVGLMILAMILGSKELKLRKKQRNI